MHAVIASPSPWSPGLPGLIVPTLAQSANARTALTEMLPWLAALLGASLVGGVVVFWLYRRYVAEPRADATSAGFMSELRAMRDRGEISEEEYDQTRLTMIARATGRDVEELRAEAIRKAGGRVAEPGFDLTGRPLPMPTDGAPPPPPGAGPGPRPRPRPGPGPSRGNGPGEGPSSERG